MTIGRNKRRAILAALVVVAVGIFYSPVVERLASPTDSESTLTWPPRSAQLVSVQELPDYGDACAPPGHNFGMIAALEAESRVRSNLFGVTSVYAQDGGQIVEVTRPPVRIIRDTYPIYSSIAVDPVREAVVLQDTNTFAIRIFNRLDNTPPGAEFTEPTRVIEGPDTENEYNNGLHIDPETGDIYNVAQDTADVVFVYSHDATGNTAPKRTFDIPHRGFALAIDHSKDEIFSTNQYPPRVLVFRKDASGDEGPLRVLEGERTGLADVHGLAIDVERNRMFVGNWGNHSVYTEAGTGDFYPPSITVYPLDAEGDTAPMRVIQGPETQLNWFGGMQVDPETGDLYVANDIGHSVLVFKGTDEGDVAPTKIIKGNRTGLSHPAGVSIDTINRELWVVNLGNSSATAYSLTASGNAAPLQTIRSAPLGHKSLKFGKPQAIAYDSARDELLVSN